MDTLALLASETPADRLGMIGKVVLGILVVVLVLAIGAAIGGLAAKLRGLLVVVGLLLLAVSLVGWIFDAQWTGMMAGAGAACLFLRTRRCDGQRHVTVDQEVSLFGNGLAISMAHDEGYQFDINYGTPPSPPRIDPCGELADIFHYINDASTSHRMGLAHSITVAPQASSDELELVCDYLRRELAIQSSPSARFSRRRDKRNYRPPGSSDDPFLGLVLGRLARLRFLDGTPYEELAFLSTRDSRIMLVERRFPAHGRAIGEILAAFLVVAAEPNGALRNSRLSESVRKWIDGPTEISEPTTKRSY